MMDSNKEPIFRSLKEKCPKFDNVYTTEKLVQQMKKYKPEKKTTTVIMMGTNDLRAREYENVSTTSRNLPK